MAKKRAYSLALSKKLQEALVELETKRKMGTVRMAPAARPIGMLSPQKDGAQGDPISMANVEGGEYGDVWAQRFDL